MQFRQFHIGLFILLGSLLFSSEKLSAQEQRLDWFVHVSSGLDGLVVTENPGLWPLAGDYKKAFTWAYEGGLRFRCAPAVFLEAGLKRSTFRVKYLGTEQVNIIDGFFVVNSGEIKRTYTFTNKYFGVPFSILIKNKRFGFRTGLQAMFFSTSSNVKSKINIPKNLIAFNFQEIKLLPLDLKTDYTLLFGLQFMINDYFYINANYFYGLNVHEQQSHFDPEYWWSFRQESFSLGFSYYPPFSRKKD